MGVGALAPSPFTTGYYKSTIPHFPLLSKNDIFSFTAAMKCSLPYVNGVVHSLVLFLQVLSNSAEKCKHQYSDGNLSIAKDHFLFWYFLITEVHLGHIGRRPYGNLLVCLLSHGPSIFSKCNFFVSKLSLKVWCFLQLLKGSQETWSPAISWNLELQNNIAVLSLSVSGGGCGTSRVEQLWSPLQPARAENVL